MFLFIGFFLARPSFQVVLGSWNPEFTICPFRARIWPFQAPKTLRFKGRMDNFEAKNTIKQRKNDKWYPFHACTSCPYPLGFPHLRPKTQTSPTSVNLEDRKPFKALRPWSRSKTMVWISVSHRAHTNGGVQQRTLLRRVLRRVLETAFEKVLRWAASIRHLMWKKFRDLSRKFGQKLSAESTCFKGSRTSCDVINFRIFWPNLGRKRSHHVMDASYR